MRRLYRPGGRWAKVWGVIQLGSVWPSRLICAPSEFAVTSSTPIFAVVGLNVAGVAGWAADASCEAGALFPGARAEGSPGAFGRDAGTAFGDAPARAGANGVTPAVGRPAVESDVAAVSVGGAARGFKGTEAFSVAEFAGEGGTLTVASGTAESEGAWVCRLASHRELRLFPC
jgi:hypothetical protein